MAFNDLERQKIIKSVEQFLEAHRLSISHRSHFDITYAVTEQSVELIKLTQSLDSSGEGRSFAKIVYVRIKNVWMVYRTDIRSDWRPYDVSPTLKAALRMIEADARKCFWCCPDETFCLGSNLQL